MSARSSKWLLLVVLAAPSASAQFRLKQSVVITAPLQLPRWLVADSCTLAMLFATNEVFRKKAEERMARMEELTFDAGSTAIVDELDSTCVYVTVKPDGPAGWVHNSLIRQTRADEIRADAAARAVKARREAAEKVDATKPLQLIDSSGTYNASSTTITGRVRNNTGRTFRYAQITFSLFDSDGTRVGTALANINDLGPGEIWKFRAIGLVASKSFALGSVTGN